MKYDKNIFVIHTLNIYDFHFVPLRFSIRSDRIHIQNLKIITSQNKILSLQDKIVFLEILSVKSDIKIFIIHYYKKGLKIFY